MACDLLLVDFDPFCVVLCLGTIACDSNYDWFQQKMLCKLAIKFQSLHVIEKHSNGYLLTIH